MRQDVTNLDRRMMREDRDYEDTPYTRLAAAIVRRAVEDMEQAMQFTPCGRKYRNRRQYLRHVREDCEAFFYSDWYKALCSIDPDKIMNRLAVKKRSKCLKTFDRKMQRARLKREKIQLESWQIKEIEKKRMRRCLK